jgi:23S rRNA-/tRNA-specific pseudouridylate synthase
VSHDLLRVVERSERDAVVVKPAGQSSEAPGARDTVIEQVRRDLQWSNAQLPHRLDRPTRGLLVIARDSAAVAVHNESIRAGRWTKYYVARVRPSTSPELLGPHTAYLRRQGRVSRVVRSGGDRADLEVLAAHDAPGRPGELHLLVRLDTGRFHQIRVMLATLGAPLVGDSDYGGAPGPFYLEHALIWMPHIDSGVATRVFDATDPGREPMHAQLLAQLNALQPRR